MRICPLQCVQAGGHERCLWDMSGGLKGRYIAGCACKARFMLYSSPLLQLSRMLRVVVYTYAGHCVRCTVIRFRRCPPHLLCCGVINTPNDAIQVTDQNVLAPTSCNRANNLLSQFAGWVSCRTLKCETSSLRCGAGMLVFTRVLL